MKRSGNPIAYYETSPATPKAGDTASFDASGSVSRRGGDLKYFWDFGDGHTASGAKVLHGVDLAEARTVAPLYERLPDFRGLSERLDPRGAFHNPWLERHVFG